MNKILKVLIVLLIVPLVSCATVSSIGNLFNKGSETENHVETEAAVVVTQPGRQLGDVFTKVNNMLCESNSEGLFITAFEGVLDLDTGDFDFVNAGHEMPFIMKSGGSFEVYKIRPGFVLAGMEDMKFRAGHMQLDPGDRLFQYTDGVTEATSAEFELFGMERLEKSLNDHRDFTPEELLPAVKQDIDAFVGEAPQFDDITMLCLDYFGKAEG